MEPMTIVKIKRPDRPKNSCLIISGERRFRQQLSDDIVAKIGDKTHGLFFARWSFTSKRYVIGDYFCGPKEFKRAKAKAMANGGALSP